jgi:hypothetical protein
MKSIVRSLPFLVLVVRRHTGTEVCDFLGLGMLSEIDVKLYYP